MIYANENERTAAAWLAELPLHFDRIDDRSIEEVSADDIRHFTQCHFFAGIGGWPYALHLAGWPASVPVWTGSCPCQPLSCAGKREGEMDKRHLWPVWYELIAECRPTAIFGEQVASKDGREWFDGISLDLEELGYAVGAADLCAASVGAPHIRQRIFWMAYLPGTGREGVDTQFAERSGEIGGLGITNSELTGRDTGTSTGTEEGSQLRPVGDADGTPSSTDRLEHSALSTGERQRQQQLDIYGPGSEAGRMGNAECGGCESRNIRRTTAKKLRPRRGNEFWRHAEYLYCRDEKWRPTEPGVSPLVHGVSGRVGLLRGYGNAIVPQVAQAFIEVSIEALGIKCRRHQALKR